MRCGDVMLGWRLPSGARTDFFRETRHLILTRENFAFIAVNAACPSPVCGTIVGFVVAPADNAIFSVEA